MKHRQHFAAICLLALLHAFPTIARTSPDSTQTAAHCIVLAEEDHIELAGTKFNFIQIYLTKTVKVKILDEEGLQYYQNLHVPELHDSHTPVQSAAINNLQPNLFCAYISEFSYWINGKKGYDPDATSEEIYRVLHYNFHYTDLVTYHLKELKVGDELVFKYVVRAPYNCNWQRFLGYRVFFNGKYPKKKYSFEMKISKNLPFMIKGENGATYTKTNQEDGETIISVSLKDLEGCTEEPGARPYTELPYLTVLPQPYSWLYLPYNANMGEFMPFHLALGRMRESNTVNIYRRFSVGTNDVTTNNVRHFLERYANDSSSLAFRKINNDIVKDFAFLDDRDFLANYDNRKVRIGAHLLEHKIRNVARYDAYRYIFVGLGLRYNTLYPCDVRAGQVGKYYYEPMADNDYLFAIGLDSTAALLLPKRSNAGYYLDELPFYYDNAVAISLTGNELFPIWYKRLNSELDLVRLPHQPATENHRELKTYIKLDEKGAGSLRSDVALSGQFSTLGRHAYRHEDCDQTVNPMYCQTLLDLPSIAGKPTVSIEEEQTVPPFNFRCKTEMNAVIAAKDGNELTISLTDLFPFVIEQQTIETPRHLSFYTDFEGTDRIDHVVQLDGDYELVETPTFELTNSYGTFTFKATMENPQQLSITAIHSITAEKIPAENIADVIRMQQAIQDVQNGQIVLRKKS
ncbi:MAG: hypothetical protein GC178_12920 [Flavobacteriales bacterium]|nr:hypothetical protein [Flavobacteriales bacterium]